jgi:hypothetical protein
VWRPPAEIPVSPLGLFPHIPPYAAAWETIRKSAARDTPRYNNKVRFIFFSPLLVGIDTSSVFMVGVEIKILS